ncbi:hypothetical protein JMN32_24190 [Fulvivirga sp. 29W222]|uniref:Uncharacterized protein n=1 Tax=Fulvivirga marina TaxID=2494733 RepID=A0A937KEC6_9BACT|nr:hypothetical protein [Fulvivirga marina]MBL6449434.1 hypothetical protein [Fulvivirga marina]
MDIELILYIIFIAIAILSRVLKSKKEGSQPTSSDQTESMDTPTRKTEKTLTFEELLREFTGEDRPVHQEPKPESGYTHQEEAYSYEEEYVGDQIQETYNRSVNEAQKLKTLDELVSLDEPLERMDHFKPYETEDENTMASEVLEMLQDEDGARKAIILSEIINRKY